MLGRDRMLQADAGEAAIGDPRPVGAFAQQRVTTYLNGGDVVGGRCYTYPHRRDRRRL